MGSRPRGQAHNGDLEAKGPRNGFVSIGAGEEGMRKGLQDLDKGSHRLAGWQQPLCPVRSPVSAAEGLYVQ